MLGSLLNRASGLIVTSSATFPKQKFSLLPQYDPSRHAHPIKQGLSLARCSPKCSGVIRTSLCPQPGLSSPKLSLPELTRPLAPGPDHCAAPGYSSRAFC